MALAWVALGSNLGNRRRSLQRARMEIAKQCTMVRMSSVYETRPMYVQRQPKFLNAVMELRTRMEPLELLGFLQGIERKLGRNRKKEVRFGPRTIDLDILAYRFRTRNAKCKTAKLTLPHPRMHERAFVLVPLYEIADRIRRTQIKKWLRRLPKTEKAGVKKIY